MPFIPELIYRTIDLLQWGNGKGARLTSTEVDQNFYDLEKRVFLMEENFTLPSIIREITVNGNQMLIIMEDYSTFGPFTLPVATFGSVANFQPNHDYEKYDLVRANNNLYMVLHPFTSGATFVFGSDIEGPWYLLIMPFPNVYDWGLFWPGIPAYAIAAGQPMFAHIFRREVFLPIGFPNAGGRLKIACTNDMSFPMQLNGNPIGSIDIAAGATAVTFNMPANVPAEVDDIFEVMPPTGGQDDTAHTLIVTFSARVGTA